MDYADYADALDAVTSAAENGISPVKALRQWRGMSKSRLVFATAMPLARIEGIESGRLTLSDDEADIVAAALKVRVDLLLD